MKVYLIRHSEPDFSQVDQAGYTGLARDLTRLTPYGIKLADKTAQNPIFNDVQMMLISPYTRTMQTAQEILKYNKIPTQVELLLHEWRPDKSGKQDVSKEQLALAYNDYLDGTHKSDLDFETKDEVVNRVKSVLDRYKDKYSCIACVTHGGVMTQFTGDRQTPFCGIYSIDY
ncbi:histidine phosphatase family protein [Companilactobacillus hulinensis]|uniref:histidine phosphatase family protein n=1 Tax=Companilactobacillus hulinensis TaxID=2486007 RepID=UPI000F788A87|nr:histidine phosphatase family protein [Companilactobacillus hulinensis]